VFFSSHVLSDAEALCSRVAVLAGGRLVAAGDLSELLAFQAHGWELVVNGLTDAALDRARTSGGVTHVTALGGQRFALELPLSVAPAGLLADLTTEGAQLVSINPIRETLEDFFVRQIGAAPKDRGLGEAPR
jgi:ABC-2 type transport system ATP-binding protein